MRWLLPFKLTIETHDQKGLSAIDIVQTLPPSQPMQPTVGNLPLRLRCGGTSIRWGLT